MPGGPKQGQLRQANQELEEASRHKSDFLANMSHELRTPLNAIIGFTSLTINALKASLPTEHLHNLRKTEKAARTLMQLISDVLDLSKIEAGEMQTHIEEVYLEDIMEEVVVTTEGLLFDKTITFTCDYPEDMPTVHTDYVKVKQILNNLVSNAVKFTTEGGISIKAAVLDHPTPNRGVRIEVQDTGCGIQEDKLPTIFESFKQVDSSIKKKFGGTGLGLAITKKFCDSLGINIGVQSEVDEGTTFWFEVPTVYQGITGQPTLTHPEPSSGPMFPELDRDALILCFARPDTCDTIRQHLDDLPLDVQQVNSVQECVQQAQHNPIWAVFIEPDNNGFEAVEQLKNEPLFAQIPVQEVPQQMMSLVNTVMSTDTQSILLVDDNQMNLGLEAEVLRTAGYTVYTAESGQASMRLATDLQPDIILMDLALPDMDGFEAAQRIKQQPSTAHATIIACSAFATSDFQQRAFEAGCEGYITKPVEPNHLVQQVMTCFLTSKIRQRNEKKRPKYKPHK